MGTAIGDKCIKLDANKFYPPRLDPARHLFRQKLVESLLAQIKQRRVLLIEARTSQGKSILAAQFASRRRIPCGWDQMGAQDGNIISFLTSLLAYLQNSLSPLLTEMLHNGEVDPSAYPRYLEIMNEELAIFLTKDAVLVFDDLNLLEELPPSQAI